MFIAKSAFSGFSVKDIKKAKSFYAETLGVKVDEDEMGLTLHLPGGATVFAYPKNDHEPATYTVLNFVVDDIEEAMNELKEKGVTFEHYNNPEMPQDEKGVLRGIKAGMGPDIAWFKDPSGNVSSVLQEQ